MKRENLPLVSIVSINYRQIGLTLEMLESLQKISYPNTEVIIVDNGSESDVTRTIKDRFPDTKVVVSKANLGFAGGNNLGLKEATGEYVLFLNNDTEVEAHFMEPLVQTLEADPTIGMASPKVLYDDKTTLQYAGAIKISPLTGRGRRIGNMETDKGQYESSHETDLPHGAALMVPMQVIKKVGPMSELFFLYYEEHDWCEIVKRAGYKVFYVAESKVYHKESMSVGKMNPLKTYYMTRNRILFVRRNVFGSKKLLNFLFFTLFTLPRHTVKYLIKREFEHLKAFYKGIFWNFQN